MADKAYEVAVAQRAALEQQIEALVAQRSRLDAFIQMYDELTGGASMAVGIDVGQTVRDQPAEVRSPRGTGAKMLDAAEEVILGAGRPMPRGDLLAAIQAQGIHVGGKDPAATLASALWRANTRFVSIKNKGYWLKELGVPDDGDPGSAFE